jgi:hypothetical protein
MLSCGLLDDVDRRYLKTLHNFVAKNFGVVKLWSSGFDILYPDVQGVPGGKVSILGGYSIGHSKQKSVYVHVSCSERFQNC